MGQLSAHCDRHLETTAGILIYEGPDAESSRLKHVPVFTVFAGEKLVDYASICNDDYAELKYGQGSVFVERVCMWNACLLASEVLTCFTCGDDGLGKVTCQRDGMRE